MDIPKVIPPRGSRRSNLRCGMSSMTCYNSIMRSPFIYSYVYIYIYILHNIYIYYILYMYIIYILCIYIYMPFSTYVIFWISLNSIVFSIENIYRVYPILGGMSQVAILLGFASAVVDNVPGLGGDAVTAMTAMAVQFFGLPHSKLGHIPRWLNHRVYASWCSIWWVSQKLGTRKIYGWSI